MRRVTMYMVAFSIVMVGAGGTAFAQQKGPVEVVAEGCKTELETYCKGVTPGEARVLACLYAYSDKLSDRCENALYDAADQLQRAVTALAYTVNECRDDLKAYCSDIKPGGGRLLQCLEKNSAKVSTRCTQAMKETGLK